jgi:hypothetical protein
LSGDDGWNDDGCGGTCGGLSDDGCGELHHGSHDGEIRGGEMNGVYDDLQFVLLVELLILQKG